MVRLSALRTGRLYHPGNIPGTHFCLRLSQPQGHSTAGRIMSMKNSNDTIGNRTRDIPACSAVPEPTAPPRAPTQHTVMAPKSQLYYSILLYRSTVLNFTQEQATKAQRRGEMYSSALSLTSALDGGGWLTSAPALYHLEITRSLLYRRLDGPQRLSGQVRKISPPPRFDPRSVQPNCTAVAHINSVSERKARNYSSSNIRTCSFSHGCDS